MIYSALRKAMTILKLMLVELTGDKKLDPIIVSGRMLALLGLAFLVLAVRDFFFIVPNLNAEALRIEGVLVEEPIRIRGRYGGNRGYKVNIETGDDFVDLYTYDRELASFLQDKVGDRFVVESVKDFDLFFISRNLIVTLQEDGVIIKQDWRRDKYKRNYLGLILMCLVTFGPLVWVYKLLNRKLNREI